MKVLVVDDDAEMLRMMTRLLGSRGHRVETCHGPFGASTLASRGRQVKCQTRHHAGDVRFTTCVARSLL